MMLLASLATSFTAAAGIVFALQVSLMEEWLPVKDVLINLTLYAPVTSLDII